MLTLTWSITEVMCKQIIGDDKKCRQIAGNFVHHASAVVRCGAHHPIEHIQGFNRSYWMPPLGKCLHCIAPVATMVEELVENTQNTNKTQLLDSNYGTFQSLLVCDNLIPQLIDANKLHKNVR